MGTKKEIDAIEAELTKICDDEANDDMSFGDMQKAVNKALKTAYSGKEWKAWFRTTAEKIIDKLDAESVTDASMDGSSAPAAKGAAAPADATKKEIDAIEAELTKICDDEANDDMSFGDMQKAVNKALKTAYSGKEWKAWFRTTAEKIIDKLDAESVTDASMDGSSAPAAKGAAAPADATKKEID